MPRRYCATRVISDILLVEPVLAYGMRTLQFELDSQPDDAVNRQPVSAKDSLLTGKFAKSRRA